MEFMQLKQIYQRGKTIFVAREAIRMVTTEKVDNGWSPETFSVIVHFNDETQLELEECKTEQGMKDLVMYIVDGSQKKE